MPRPVIDDCMEECPNVPASVGFNSQCAVSGHDGRCTNLTTLSIGRTHHGVHAPVHERARGDQPVIGRGSDHCLNRDRSSAGPASLDGATRGRPQWGRSRRPACGAAERTYRCRPRRCTRLSADPGLAGCVESHLRAGYSPAGTAHMIAGIATEAIYQGIYRGRLPRDEGTVGRRPSPRKSSPRSPGIGARGWPTGDPLPFLGSRRVLRRGSLSMATRRDRERRPVPALLTFQRHGPNRSHPRPPRGDLPDPQRPIPTVLSLVKRQPRLRSSRRALELGTREARTLLDCVAPHKRRIVSQFFASRQPQLLAIMPGSMPGWSMGLCG